MVNGLDSGSNYLVVLVATTGSGETALETESDEITVKTLGSGTFHQKILGYQYTLRDNLFKKNINLGNSA